jgi:cell division septal protein FtsQ
MKRGTIRGLGAVGLVLALVGGFRVVRTLAFFRVRRVELAGARYLTAAGVARALAIAPGRSIFDGTDSLRKRARGMLGVVEARVTRRLPGTIRVTVREAEPVALAPRGGRLVLVDAGGRVLPFDPTRPAADLPLAEADSALAGLLARVREAEPALYGRVERAVRVPPDVAIELDAGRILFRSGASGEEIRDVSLVADLLARQGRRWRELDARFLPHVVIRGASA